MTGPTPIAEAAAAANAAMRLIAIAQRAAQRSDEPDRRGTHNGWVARPFENLSPYELEELVSDLFSEGLDQRFERFTRGADGGIDLRAQAGRSHPDVIQVKHYKGSSFSNLKSDVKREVKKVEALDPAPRTYRLVTTQGLTPKNKTDLIEVLGSWVRGPQDIYGRDELEDLLNKHEEVERRHVKLWLTSGTALATLLRAATYNRSRALAENIQRMLPLYVQGRAFAQAREQLDASKVLIIAGEPGIGKTTLSYVLVADAVVDGYEMLEISSDVEEAWEALDETKDQIFIYDDFLGRTLLGELGKDDEQRLLSFMGAVARSPKTRLILTTREYILNQAREAWESFRRHGLGEGRFVLALPSYTPLDRARILRNHVWHSDLPNSVMNELATDRGYRRIVDHRHFNPRIIEFITGLQRGHELALEEGQSWLDAAHAALDKPHEIWRQAFERELSVRDRALLFALATMADRAEFDDLHAAFDSWCETAGVPASPRRFENAMKVVDDSFVSTDQPARDRVFVRFVNPGLADFVQSELICESSFLTASVDGAVYFEQLTRLSQLMANSGRSQRQLPAGFAERLHSLLNSKSDSWVLAQSGRHPGAREYMARRPTSPDARLSWLVTACRVTDPAPGLVEVTEAIVRERIEDWRQGNGDTEAALGLANLLAEPGQLPQSPDNTDGALAQLLRANLHLTRTWQDYLSLAERVHGYDALEADADLKSEFWDFAEAELSDGVEDMHEPDDIDTIEYLAQRLGVELDPASVESARSDLQEHLNEIASYDDIRAEADEERWREERGDRRSDDDEMDAMFQPRP